MNLKDNFDKEKIYKIFQIIKDKVLYHSHQRKSITIASAAVIGIAAVSFAAIKMMSPDAYMLAVNDVPFAYIENPAVIEEAIGEIKTEMSESKGVEDIIFDDSALKCTAVRNLKKDANILSEEQLKEKFLLTKLFTADVWGISVNDNDILALATEEDAKKVLDSVIANYQTAGSKIVSTVYKENVKVVQQKVPASDVLTIEDGVNLLLTGNAEPKTYVVQPGDTVWDIAKGNNMTTNQLQQMNPGFDPNKIQIGQTLNLVEMHPYITIVTKEQVTKEEKVDFETVFENTNTLYKGEVKVKTAGVYGKKETITEIVKENGVQTSAVDLGTTVVSQPQTQVAYRGTKSLSTFVGSGSFTRPVPLNVSSPFGSRGGGRHTGVDLRNPKGTPINVADDGVVTFAAYSGSYGNIVKVSHGNGVETWYAHCNTMLVSVGERVSKGQQIATVGITGRATGYHLHFEVRKNGVPQNPMNYL
ncbi:MAG: peptidoglycan DD-metalloendopeptidase family protein [Anaerovorax sp.]|nr:peptidoglycan DD-metalloendopeptidase family protein [Anaerovorax sp.]